MSNEIRTVTIDQYIADLQRHRYTVREVYSDLYPGEYYQRCVLALEYQDPLPTVRDINAEALTDEQYYEFCYKLVKNGRCPGKALKNLDASRLTMGQLCTLWEIHIHNPRSFRELYDALSHSADSVVPANYPSLCRTAVQENYSYLRYIYHPGCDDETYRYLIRSALAKDIALLNSVPPDLRPPQFCIQAIEDANKKNAEQYERTVKAGSEAEIKLFHKSIPLLYANRDCILAEPRFYSVRIPRKLAFISHERSPLAKIFALWDIEQLTITCHRCGGKGVVHTIHGSPMTGACSLSGICTVCGKTVGESRDSYRAVATTERSISSPKPLADIPVTLQELVEILQAKEDNSHVSET
jgi:hypothetical protein